MAGSTPGVMSFDIDGTLTADAQGIPAAVLRCLEGYAAAGWTLLFITGRPHCWAQRSLAELVCRYYLAAINGANIIAMPEGTSIYNREIAAAQMRAVAAIGARRRSDPVIYGGYRHGDLCYWRPQRFSERRRRFLEERYRALGEQWVTLAAEEPFPIEECASIKYFGDYAYCRSIADEVGGALSLQTPVIRDPFAQEAYVLQITDSQCNKGTALRHCLSLLGVSGPVIAAGDDYNDVSMLELADIAIVMATAPAPLLSLADVVAPAASCNGIIQGLQSALRQLAL